MTNLVNFGDIDILYINEDFNLDVQLKVYIII